jgi:D-alanyl-D-alanine carboxypeptidase/D-alanyl-D-alanine-endopeptidase (penicillin-binding protein 4)
LAAVVSRSSLIVLLALALTGCGTSHAVASHPSPPHRRLPAGHSAMPVRAGQRTRPPQPAGDIALTALRRALRAALSKAGPNAGAAVYDLTAHRTLFDARGGIAHPPASVEKLYTTAAVLRTLGPGTTLQTQVLGTGHLGRHGVWHGNLYFKGGGDPTLGDGAFNQSYELGFGPTGSQMAAQIASHGIRRVTGRLFGDESLFDHKRGGLMTNYAPDIPDFGGELSALTYDHGSTIGTPNQPAAFAARQLAAAMRTAHITVRASKPTAITPVDAQPLATVSSPPMQVLLRLMDVPSDDFFAELLTKQLGVRFGDGVGSIAAGAQVISDTIAADYGIHPRIRDGSGLSRNDRSSPDQVVTLLSELWRTPTGDIVYASLPVVGRSGTVQSIALKTAAVGRCSAKTGTLTDVTNLAGYCHSRGEHALAFAVFIDGPPNYIALALEGQVVAAIARY